MPAAYSHSASVGKRQRPSDFRKNLFDHLHTMSVSYFVKRRTGEIMSRMTNDVTTIENIVTDLPATVLQQSIRLIGGIIIIIYM